MSEPAVYTDLKAGTFLRHRHGGGRIGMDENMRGSWAYCYDARKDGKPHRGRIGWSGCLRKADWRLESLQVRSGSCAALSHHVAMNLRTGGATRTGSMTKTAQGDLRLEFASLVRLGGVQPEISVRPQVGQRFCCRYVGWSTRHCTNWL